MKTIWISTLISFTLSLFVFLPHTDAVDTTPWTQRHLPEGTKARLGKGSMSEITYSPDGSLLAVGSSIGVWLYDADTGEELTLLRRETPGVVEWKDKDGVYGVKDRVLGRVVGMRTNDVNSVAFSPDGNTIATGGHGGMLRLWDVNTKTEIATLIAANPTYWVNSVAFSPDGKTIATGSNDKTVRLWDVNTKTEIATLTGSDRVYSVAFSPDGNTIATGTDGTVRLWDVNTKTEIATITTGHKYNYGIYSLAFSPDGNTIATIISTYSERTEEFARAVQLWDVNTKTEITTLAENTSSLAFSPDGNTIATYDGQLRLWDVNTKTEIATLGHESAFGLAFSPDGKTLVTRRRDGTAQLWDVATLTPRTTLTGYISMVFSVAFSPDGKTLAIADSPNALRLWDVATLTPRATFTEYAGVEYAGSRDNFAFSPDGNTIATGIDGTVRLWDVNTKTEIATLTGPDWVYSVAFSPDGNTIATGTDGTVRLWDVNTKTEIATLGHKSARSLAFSPDGNTIAIANHDKTVRLWDVNTGTEIATLTGLNRGDSSVAFSPDGNTIATYDGQLRLWDVNTDTNNIVIPGCAGGFAFSPDGNTIAAGDAYGRVRLRNVDAAIPREVLIGHTSRIRSIAFSPDGRTMASGGWDGTVLLWDVTPTEPEKITEDVNGDGEVNIQDLVAVAAALGQTGENAADVNGDSEVNIQDLVAVAAAIGEVAAAPAALRQQGATHLTQEEVQHWLTQAQQANLTDATSVRGIRFLEQLLLAFTPKKTALLANYPNPFNPETWIPYQLATHADVHISIYTADGKLVRMLDLGHQPVGTYQGKSRAAHWDGRNTVGEPVASGVYFYTLTAGDFTATRKMLILK